VEELNESYPSTKLVIPIMTLSDFCKAPAEFRQAVDLIHHSFETSGHVARTTRNQARNNLLAFIESANERVSSTLRTGDRGSARSDRFNCSEGYGSSGRLSVVSGSSRNSHFTVSDQVNEMIKVAEDEIAASCESLVVTIASNPRMRDYHCQLFAERVATLLSLLNVNICEIIESHLCGEEHPIFKLQLLETHASNLLKLVTRLRTGENNFSYFVAHWFDTLHGSTEALRLEPQYGVSQRQPSLQRNPQRQPMRQGNLVDRTFPMNRQFWN
jgi:hypothetical protein